MQVKSVFDLFRFDLMDLNYRTELLESHGWDEEALSDTLSIVRDFINSNFHPNLIQPNFDFDKWVMNSVNNELINLGLLQEQSRIVCRLIINRKEEFLTLMNLEDN